MNPRPRRPRGGSPERATKPLRLSALHPLSSRLADVVHWIAAGKRNGEIGQILTISRRTVEKHVQLIFKALHVETRGAAGSWSHEQRLKLERARARNRR